jgi:uncharacterized protein
VASRFIPSRLLGAAPSGGASDLPLLAGRAALGGTPTAYVCRGYACERPVTDPADLWDQLASVSRAAAGA